MQASIKYISSTSGKSILLTIGSKIYVFNIFEGFQRYCIDKGISLKNICTIFVPTLDGISPLCGLYLTLRDMNHPGLIVVCCKNIQSVIEKVFSFCPPNNFKLKFTDSIYEDDLLKVTEEYIIQINPVKGRFKIENVPTCIPKIFYKDLKNKKNVIINGIKYLEHQFVEQDTIFDKIYFLFTKKYFECDFNSIVLCSEITVYKYYAKKCRNIYFLKENSNIDFVSQYNLLLGLNRISSDYLIPASRFLFLIKKQRFAKFELRKKIFNDGDMFVYHTKCKSFVLKRSKKKNYVPCKNEELKNTILFLGTGCAIPSKYRNVSATLLNIENRYFLFDCGEDTISQLIRIFGFYKIIDRIDLIFISHSHGDHVLGLINLIRKLKHKVKLFAPATILEFCKLFTDKLDCYQTDYAKLLEFEYFQNIVDNSLESNSSNLSKFIQEYRFEYTVKICGCMHNIDSCSISIETDDFKVSYSGDTRPSPLFAYISNKATVMIHESTFGDDSIEKSIKTRHSTVEEANEIFNLSNSEVLILTHFSQRYPKQFLCSNKNIAAFDFYRYCIGKSVYKHKEIEKYFSDMELKR